jgi:hypothetical protein
LLLQPPALVALNPASLHSVNPATHFPPFPFSPTTMVMWMLRGMNCNAQIACFPTLSFINLRQPHHKTTTCLTYRNTESAPTAGNMHMGSRMQCPTGGRTPPPLLSSLTGSGLRSLFLAISISRGAVLGLHSGGDSKMGEVMKSIVYRMLRWIAVGAPYR